MPSERPEKISLKTALLIANTFGPATATHYLLRHELHEEILEDRLPGEFIDLLAKLNAAAETKQREQQQEEQQGSSTRDG